VHFFLNSPLRLLKFEILSRAIQAVEVTCCHTHPHLYIEDGVDGEGEKQHLLSRVMDEALVACKEQSNHVLVADVDYVTITITLNDGLSD